MECTVCGRDRENTKAVLFGEKKAVCPDCKNHIRNLDNTEKETESAVYLRNALKNSHDNVMKDYLTSVLNGETPTYPAYYNPKQYGVDGESKVLNKVNLGASLISFPDRSNVGFINPPDMAAHERNGAKALHANLAFIGMIAFAAIGIILGVLFAVIAKNILFLFFSILVGGGIAAGLFFLSKYLRIQHKILYSAECQRNNSRKVIELLEEKEKK